LTILAGAVSLLAISAVADAAPCATSSPTCFRPAFIRTGGAPVPNPPLTVEVTDTDDVLLVPDVQIEMNALFGDGSAEFVKELVMNLDPHMPERADLHADGRRHGRLARPHHAGRAVTIAGGRVRYLLRLGDEQQERRFPQVQRERRDEVHGELRW